MPGHMLRKVVFVSPPIGAFVPCRVRLASTRLRPEDPLVQEAVQMSGQGVGGTTITLEEVLRRPHVHFSLLERHGHGAGAERALAGAGSGRGEGAAEGDAGFAGEGGASAGLAEHEKEGVEIQVCDGGRAAGGLHASALPTENGWVMGTWQGHEHSAFAFPVRFSSTLPRHALSTHPAWPIPASHPASSPPDLRPSVLALADQIRGVHRSAAEAARHHDAQDQQTHS